MEQGKRRRVIGLAAGIAALATMAFGGSTAQAAPQPLQATFDDAALNIGGFEVDILEPPDVATATGTIDPLDGAVNIPANQFVFPDFVGTVPPGIEAAVALEAVDPITGGAGAVDLDTGVVTLNSSNFHATVSVPALSYTCNYTFALALSTINGPNDVYPGDPFTMVQGNPITAVNGTLQDGWAVGGLGSDSGSACPTFLNDLAQGAGGIALANGIDLTPEPAATPPPATSTPSTAAPAPVKKKKCKKGFVKKKVKGKKKCVKKKKRK